MINYMVILPIVDAQYYLIILRLKAYVYECNTKRKNWGSILDSARVQKNEFSDKESNQKAKTLSTAEMWSPPTKRKWNAKRAAGIQRPSDLKHLALLGKHAFLVLYFCDFPLTYEVAKMEEGISRLYSMC